MGKYAALIKIGIHKELAYRTNFCIGIFSTLILFLVEISIWSAVYQEKAQIGTVTYGGMVIYAIMAALLQRLFGSGSDEQIGEDFQSGTIVTSFLIPLHLPVKYSLQELGKGILNAAVLLLLVLPYCIWKKDVFASVSLGQWLFFVVSVVFAYILFSILNYMLGILTFWTNANIGIYMLKIACINIFSGMFIPVVFYPVLLRRLCMALPFQAIYYFPLSIVMGEAVGMQAICGMACQLLWIGGLLAICIRMHQRAMRRTVIQGG